MVIITSLFLVQLLCVLVPCNPRYPDPDLSPSHHNHDHDKLGRSHFLEKLWPGFLKNNDGPLVSTKDGLILGYPIKVVGGSEIFAFEGIKYAEAPIGQLRFRSPIPKKAWNGVYHAFSSGNPCLQYNFIAGFRILGSEDCLFLSIYSPKVCVLGNLGNCMIF